jgi:mono/diheme cytochrome c family protein
MRGPFFACMLAISGCGSVAEQSEPEPPPVAFAGALVVDASSRIAHGKRIADVLGCTGCHGAALQGQRFYELYASNLTRDMPGYSDAQFRKLLLEGVHPTGRDVWGMPSEVFQHLSGPDLDSLIAFLRSLPPAGEPTQPHLPFEPETKEMIAAGILKPADQWVRETRWTTPVDLGPAQSLGRYMSMVTCAECHGADLSGGEGGAPDLIVAGAYSRDEFETLMTKGIAPGQRQLKLMAAVSRERFSQMTRQERDSLHAYLKARAQQPQ